MSDAGRPAFEVIELIDADPTAFGGPAAEGLAAPIDQPHTPHRSAVPSVTMGVLALLLAAVLVAVALPPLRAVERPGRVLSFPPLRRQLSTLDGHLVFAEPPGTVSSAGLGAVSADGGATPSPLRNLTGYVFAAPNAHFTLSGEESGRWAGFWSAPRGSIDEPGPIGTPDAQVQGTPASIDTYGNETVIVFGPVDGRTFSVRTYDLGRDASLRFAETVAIRDGVPTITDDRALADMRPVGSIAEYGAALDAVLTPGESAIPSTNLVFVQYAAAAGRYTLASVPAAHETMLPMLHFLMPQGHERTVRGTTGWVVGDGVTPDLLGSGTGTLLAWVEGGRLILVIGPDDELATLALADSIRPATDDEWDEVATAATNTPNPLDSSIDADVVLDVGTTAEGDAYSLTATWRDPFALELCAETAIGRGCSYLMEVPLPVLVPLQWGSSTFLAALVDDATVGQAFLVLTFADPAIAPQAYPLVNQLIGYGRSLPGPAVGLLLPDGVATAELRVDGVVVATWPFSPPG
ncbi:MAG: hypothetical protein Q7V57_06975 [Actinomycetota bacterium]|nr:hypothetical protein [Actinomycetota bacterium]